MNQDQLLRAVLTEAGWKNLNTNWALPPDGDFMSDKCPRNDKGQPLLLTSRDAVWEVLGLKDIEDEYWNYVESVVWKANLQTDNYDTAIMMCKATCPQLLEAWLQYRKQT